VTAEPDPPSLPLFIYGSLRDPGVRARLLGPRDDLSTCRATLRGHARMLVPGFGYPFVVPASPGDRVDGDMLLGLQPADYVVLDAYEDVDDGLYRRDVVTVEAADGEREAWVYLKGPAEPPRA
jgi:gamma-glutamylcyclotransferase (GGCT)/AIG2-like uncharacterized protein YtfP